MAAAATSINDMIALSDLTKTTSISIHNPEKMGNTADIAFGGCVLSMAMNAAVRVVPSEFFLYSAQGYYLGPTLASEKLVFVLVWIRDTKTFKTVRVEAKQLQKEKERVTFYLTLDFQVKEQTALLYNLEPRMKHPPPESCLDHRDYLQQRVDRKQLHPKIFEAWSIGFALFSRFFESRPCPEGVSTQNVLGMDKRAKTTQDGLHITQKSSASWFRSRTEISRAESYAAIGFVTDAALAFIPATFNNQFIDDYGPLSSLDCSLRFHTNDFSCNDWMLHEQVTEAGNDGRTFSTGRVFRQDGTLVATMQQMSIMRPKVVKAVNLKL